MADFTDEQRRWLEGFTSGLAARKAVATPAAPPAANSYVKILVYFLALDAMVIIFAVIT